MFQSSFKTIRQLSKIYCSNLTTNKQITDAFYFAFVLVSGRLSNDFELKITPADKTSFQVSWRTVELSHSFDLLEFRVRWNDITNLPASMRKRLLGEARLIRSTRSVTTIAGDTQISGPNLDDIDNGNIQITNETVALIQKLTPGSKYVIQVTALIKVQDTGRTEELWYPQKSYRMGIILFSLF